MMYLDESIVIVCRNNNNDSQNNNENYPTSPIAFLFLYYFCIVLVTIRKILELFSVLNTYVFVAGGAYNNSVLNTKTTLIRLGVDNLKLRLILEDLLFLLQLWWIYSEIGLWLLLHRTSIGNFVILGRSVSIRSIASKALSQNTVFTFNFVIGNTN